MDSRGDATEISRLYAHRVAATSACQTHGNVVFRLSHSLAALKRAENGALASCEVTSKEHSEERVDACKSHVASRAPSHRAREPLTRTAC